MVILSVTSPVFSSTSSQCCKANPNYIKKGGFKPPFFIPIPFSVSQLNNEINLHPLVIHRFLPFGDPSIVQKD